ncbi:deoxynucleoside kinase [Dethiothermospora halolimnae]|uniref:deoxynucleoside kinase n=1 Tax=Dethiothermospora halolimnae TaxID=3114390 RepID=UPI003CCC0735
MFSIILNIRLVMSLSFIVSIQGGMACGKTTLGKYIESNLKDVKVSYENPGPVIKEIKRLGLDKYKLKDYIEIQRLFINAEIERYNRLKSFDKVIIDLGPEEIEFYTLYFPKSIDKDWNIEELLKDELHRLRQCKLDGILYLDASKEVLRKRKEGDQNRSRNFFDHYINNLHTYKKQWFSKYDYTTFINVDNMSIDKLGAFTTKWLEEI